MRAVSLFAGIGGFDLAMERAGVDVVASAEIDKDCRSILRRHFPSTGQFDDVRKVTAESLYFAGVPRGTNIDLVTSGWPCQGNSVAGLRKGMEDPRSGLWSENVRVLSELHPKWFVGENVPGLLSVRSGRDFQRVIESLAELGYGLAWRVLDAQYTGVPQRRRRVIIVGCLGDPRRAAQVLFDTEGVYGDPPSRGKARPEVAGTSVVSTLQGGGRRGYRVDAESAAGGHLIPVCVTGDVTHTLTSEGHDASEDGSGRATPIVTAFDAYNGSVSDTAYALDTKDRCARGVISGTLTASYANGTPSWAIADGTCAVTGVGVRRLTPIECERLQGFPDGWTEGQSDSARYRQLGNAVAVPVIQWVMDRIVAANEGWLEERMAA